MVLVVVCELVVHEDRALEGLWDGEADGAEVLLGEICHRGVAGELPLRSDDGRRGVPGYRVAVGLARDVCKGVVRSCELALGVVDGKVADFVRCPEQDGADGGEDDSNDEECGQDLCAVQSEVSEERGREAERESV